MRGKIQRPAQNIRGRIYMDQDGRKARLRELVRKNNMKTARIIKFTIFLALLTLLALAGYHYGFDINRAFSSLKELSGARPLPAALTFIFLFTAVKFTFVPITSASILAGYLFGASWGALIAVIAIAFSSSLMFLLARWLGRDFVEIFVSQKLSGLERYNLKLEQNGLLAVLILRMLPVLPLAVVNLGLGLSRLRFTDYFLGTIFGSLPGVFLLVNAGEYLTDWNNPLLYVFLGLYLFMIISAFYLTYKIRAKL